MRRLRALREQQEIARRLMRPIDLQQAEEDLQDMGRAHLLDQQDSLIPMQKEDIAALYEPMFTQSLADQAYEMALRKTIQDKVREAGASGAPINSSMVKSVIQLDR